MTPSIHNYLDNLCFACNLEDNNRWNLYWERGVSIIVSNVFTWFVTLCVRVHNISTKNDLILPSRIPRHEDRSWEGHAPSCCLARLCSEYKATCCLFLVPANNLLSLVVHARDDQRVHLALGYVHTPTSSTTHVQNNWLVILLSARAKLPQDSWRDREASNFKLLWIATHRHGRLPWKH
jgi:hypothetical protein